MNKEKAIEVLKGLRDYVNENWDEEYRKDIDNANEAINIACATLKEKKIAGELSIGNKKYLVCKGE